MQRATPHNGNATGNTINLVGVGATYGDYTGGSISVGEIDPGYTRNGRGTSAGNALNVFGAGVSAGSINVRRMQRLSFHMTNNLLTDATAEMLDLTEPYQLDLGNFVVSDGTDTAVAAAMLIVEQGERGFYHRRLKLVCTTVYPDVPEPATGALGLLALTALAARRRKRWR